MLEAICKQSQDKTVRKLTDIKAPPHIFLSFLDCNFTTHS